MLEKVSRGNRVPVLVSVLPGLALFVTFYVIAMGTLVTTAFTDWSVNSIRFVGLDNFTEFLTDGRFWMAVRNTAFFIAAALLVQIPVATMVALTLARRIRGWKTIRALLFLPNMISGAALGLVYVFVFNPRFGLVNAAMDAVGLGGLTRDWLADTGTALFAVTATWVFNIGLFVILILAEIHSLPREVGEAAQVDGANRVQHTWWITLPLIRPVVATCALLAALAALAQFDSVYVMTGGGPADRTLTVGLYSYDSYMTGDWGPANAVGLFILMVGVLLILLVRQLGRTEHATR